MKKSGNCDRVERGALLALWLRQGLHITRGWAAKKFEISESLASRELGKLSAVLPLDTYTDGNFVVWYWPKDLMNVIQLPRQEARPRTQHKFTGQERCRREHDALDI